MRSVLTVLVVSGLLTATVGAQTPAPQTYTLSAVATQYDAKITVTVYRDGPRERVEMASAGLPGKMITLYDLEAHNVYWIMPGPQATCSAGRYLSARAPIGEDPVTGSAQTLANLPKGSQRKVVRQESVNGIPARLEDIVVPTNASAPDVVQPSRLWLSEPDGMIVKMEGAPRGGRPSTMFEVTQFTKDKPEAALFVPPAACPMTNAEMDDSGVMRARAEADIRTGASGQVNLADQTDHSTVSVSGAQGKTPGQSPAAGVATVALQTRDLPGPSPCGRKLEATGTVTVTGPATIWYRFYANVNGPQFSGGDQSTITLDAAGSANLAKDVTFPTSRTGELRLEAAVQGPDGRHGAVKVSNVATFRVVCGAAPSAK